MNKKLIAPLLIIALGAPYTLVLAQPGDIPITSVPSFNKEGEVIQTDLLAQAPTAKPAPATQTAARKVVFNPKEHRDPTLSPDEMLLLELYERERKRFEEQERQRKAEAEKKAAAERERQRRLALLLLKDPTIEVRDRIRIGGIIGQEVFIGNKIYTVGKSIHGAKIVKILPEEVVFLYKGHRFTKRVQLR